MTVRSNYGIKMFLNRPKVTQQVLDNQLRFLKGAFITFKNPSGSFSLGELMNIRNVDTEALLWEICLSVFTGKSSKCPQWDQICTIIKENVILRV